MLARELRAGNRLIRPNGNIAQATWGVIKDVEDGDSTYKPIPLTEDWLLKFGFESAEFFDGASIRVKSGSLFVRFYKGSNICYIRYGKHVDQKLDLIDCDYVHQLQNLYFALTQEELKLKEIA